VRAHRRWLRVDELVQIVVEAKRVTCPSCDGAMCSACDETGTIVPDASDFRVQSDVIGALLMQCVRCHEDHDCVGLIGTLEASGVYLRQLLAAATKTPGPDVTLTCVAAALDERVGPPLSGRKKTLEH